MGIRTGFRWSSKPPIGYGIDASHPLAPGLLVSLLLNEGTGEPFDAAGRRTFPVASPGTWTPTAKGLARYATGGTSAVEIPASALAGFPVGGYTFRVLFRPRTYPGGFTTIFDEADRTFSLFLDTTGNRSFGIAPSQSWNLAAGSWWDLTLTLTAAQLLAFSPGNAFINGVPVGTYTYPSTTATAGPICFGRNSSGGGSNADADYALIQLWLGRALTAPEVAAAAADPYGLHLAPATRRLFAAPTGGGGNTGTLGASAQSAAVALAGTVVPPAITGTLGAAAQAAAVALAGTNTPPAITATLGLAGQASAVALAATVTPPAITGSLGAAAQAAALALAGTNTPPAITGALGLSSGASSVAFAGLTFSGVAGTLGAAGQSASVAFAGTNTPPAVTGALGAQGQPAALALGGTVLASIAGSLGATAQPAALGFAGTNTPPAVAAILAMPAQAASVAFAGGGFTPTPSLCPPLPLMILLARRRRTALPPILADYLEEAIVARVLATSALTAVIGARVYPVVLPQSRPLSAPAISFETGEDDEQAHLTGESGIVRASVKFECRAPRQAQAVQLRELLRNAFGGFRGRVGSVDIRFVRSDGRSTDYDEPADSSDAGTHVSTCGFRFTYIITPPTF